MLVNKLLTSQRLSVINSPMNLNQHLNAGPSMYRTLKIAVFFLFFLLTCSPMLQADSLNVKENSREDPRVLASGQGFEITTRDVEMIRAFLEEHTPFRTSQDQYARHALQMNLFAREALSMGLAGEEWKNFEPDKAKELAIFSDVYVEYLKDSYQLDDLVIESYYHAFPEKFLKNPGSEEVREVLMERGFIPEDWIRPLDEVLGDIRAVLLRNKQRQILQAAFEDLKEKYDAVIH